ncbi:MAG: M3 family metallopeptidase [Planctomycetota bacterium]
MVTAADLSHDYARLHTAKEDAFWNAYMGLTEDADKARAALDAKEKELAAWLQDPTRLADARAALDAAKGDDRIAIEGWVHMLEAHGIDSAEGRELAAAIIDLEGALARARGAMKLGYTDPDSGEFVSASSVKLGTMTSVDDDERMRKAAWEGMRAIEPHVLANGYIDVVRARNRLGRMLGGEDYYDWKVKRVEGMSKKEIFVLLDELMAKTADRHAETLRSMDPADCKPWNFRYAMAGDVTKELDPYFPFSRALERWGRSFAALGVEYRDATMVLDLVDRKGKYENGFCHGPVPSWRDSGDWVPARVQFTANAIPGMVGSGKRATETLFHEGGHAAHFANVDMPAPCFSQEFAPTSVAFAEVQSMFLDSILNDADWQMRYAQTADGEAMPFELVEKAIRVRQRAEASSLRAMCTICYAERTIYEIPDDELTAERVLAELRRVENECLGMDASRPALSVPHLLAGESSAYYHGYVLALMGVEQTREHFLRRDGHLMDNPKIGPEMQRVYWKPGNSKSFPAFIEEMTGETVSADALARAASRTPDEAVEEAKKMVAKAESIPAFDGAIELQGTFTVAHGNETIASTKDDSFETVCDKYARWIENQQ